MNGSSISLIRRDGFLLYILVKLRFDEHVYSLKDNIYYSLAQSLIKSKFMLFLSDCIRCDDY